MCLCVLFAMCCRMLYGLRVVCVLRFVSVLCSVIAFCV